MSSLLDLTVQGDVGTLADDSRLRAGPEIQLMGPLELYRLWERQNWVSHEIDLEQDRRDWLALSERDRQDMMWGLSGFFVGEERVANQFSGLVMAAEDKHEEAFLLTQQVDEARHAQHFNRLFEEVFGVDGRFEDRLVAARRNLNDDFRDLFDVQLVEAHDALLRDPANLEAKVDFVVVYHMVIEGTLALTGQYFQTLNMERRGILPGHLRAFGLISRDEHRHVAYGTWFLQRAARDPALARRIQERLAAALPPAAGVLVPRRFHARGGREYINLGVPGSEINAFAYTALSRRLKVIGVGLPAIAAA
jgi:ribonucleoside-diphosphate reductase beta chain